MNATAIRIKMISSILPLVLITLFSNGQQNPGIKFEHGLTWSQIKEKARKENKGIFLDAFTTWCVPCKMMDVKIFPQQKVGEFFNANFINVKVQIDSTEKDKEDVKAWYADAVVIRNTFNIHSFPTFLFFNPAGELVHRINGASPNAEEFIANAEAALSPYAKNKWAFETGKRDSTLLLTLMKDAQLMNDTRFLPVITNEYLTTQDNLLTERNIKLLAKSTKKTSDPGFIVLKEDADKVDAILGKGVSKGIVETVVFDEIVFPYLMKNGEKIDYGGMVNYTGEVNKKVDWAIVEKELNKRFPDLAAEVILMAKTSYFLWLEDWKSYTEFIFVNKGRISTYNLANYANIVSLFCAEKQSLERARDWMKDEVVGTDANDWWHSSIYSNLLYKTGLKEAAIKIMEKVVAQFPGEERDDLKKTLAKMKNNEKI